MFRLVVIGFTLLCASAASAQSLDIYRTAGQCLSGYPEGNPWQGGPFNSVAGDYCPNDIFTWETLTVDAYSIYPAQTVELGPNALSTSVQIPNKAAAGPVVYEQARRASTARYAFELAWAAHIRAGYPMHVNDVNRGIDYGQVFEITYLATHGARDTSGPTPTFAVGRTEADFCSDPRYAHARCAAVRPYLISLEQSSRATDGYGLTYEALEAIYALWLETPAPAEDDVVCGRPIVCGQYRAEQLAQ